MGVICPGAALPFLISSWMLVVLTVAVGFEDASLAHFLSESTLSLVVRTNADVANMTVEAYGITFFDNNTARPWRSLRCDRLRTITCVPSALSFDAYIPASALRANTVNGVFVLNMTSTSDWTSSAHISIKVYTTSTDPTTPSLSGVLLDTSAPVLAGSSTTFDPLPPATAAYIPQCSDIVCSKAEFKCFPIGGNPAAAVPCEELDFPACPTVGCGPQEPVRRIVACYEGFGRLQSSAGCARNAPTPPSVRECPRVYESCTGYISPQAECLDSDDVSHNCSSGPRDVSFRRGECRDTTGVVVSSSWCRYEKTNVMCNLPPCNRRWEARWFASEPSPCYSGPDATCASYRTVDVACRYTLLSDSPGSYPTANSVWIDTSLSVCDQRSAPTRILRCSPSTPLTMSQGAVVGSIISRCLNGGVCRLSDAFVSGERYASATGLCQCPLGFTGMFCGTAAWIRNVTVTYVTTGTKRYVISWERNVEAPPSTLASVLLSRIGDSLNATAAEAAQLETPALPVARVKIGTGIFTLDPLKFLDVLPGSWMATVRVSQALRASSVSFTVAPKCEGRCINGGVCDGQTALCTCLPGYSGDRCEKSPCDTSGCSDDSTCENMPDGTFKCTCPVSPTTGLPLLQGPTCTLPYNMSICPADLLCQNGGSPYAFIGASGDPSCSGCSCPNSWRFNACLTCTAKCNGGVHNADCTGCDCANALGYHGADCRCRYVEVSLNFPVSAVPWLALPVSAPLSARARAEAKYRWSLLLSHEILAFMRGSIAPATTADDFAIVAPIVGFRQFNTTAGVDMVKVTLRVGADCLVGNNGVLRSEAPEVPTAELGPETAGSGDTGAAPAFGSFSAASDAAEPPVAALIGGPTVTPIDITRVYVFVARLRAALADGSAAGTEILKSFDTMSGAFIYDPLCVAGTSVNTCPTGTGSNGQADEWVAPSSGTQP